MSSCDLIADEIALLNAEIASLRQENFVTRYEFEQFKRLTNNGQYLLQNASFVNDLWDKMWEFNRRMTPEPIKELQDRITNEITEELQDRGLLPGSNRDIWAALNEEKRRRETEDYKLWYELRYEKQKLQELKRNWELDRKNAVLLDKKVADLSNKFKLSTTNIAKNTADILKLKIDLKLLQTGLAKLTASLPMLIKSIVISLIATGVFNGIVSGVVGLWNNAKLNELKTKTDTAFNTALNAWNRSGTAKEKAEEAQSQTKKFNGLIAAINARIDVINEKFPAIERLIKQSRNAATVTAAQISSIVENKIAPLAKTIGTIAISVAGLTITVAALQKIGNVVLPRVGLTPTLTPMSPTLPGLTPTAVQNNYYYTTNNYPRETIINRETTIINNGNNADLTWIKAKLIELETLAKTNLTISGIMNNKLGNQIKDGLSGWMTRFTNWSVFSRLMELMTLAATIHNAMMLSNNLTTTLISSIQNVVNFLELKDSEGKGYDVQSLIKTSIESFLKNMLGAENYSAMNTAWKNANRIYQSAGNLFNSMLNFGDVVTQALQLIAGDIGKIGNALKAWGKVGESAYPWMNPNPNFNNPLLMKLNNLNDAASVVEEVSQQPQSIKDAKKEVADNAEQLAKDIGQAADGKDGKIFPEAFKVKAEETNKKVNSPGQEMDRNDLEADE